MSNRLAPIHAVKLWDRGGWLPVAAILAGFVSVGFIHAIASLRWRSLPY